MVKDLKKLEAGLSQRFEKYEAELSYAQDGLREDMMELEECQQLFSQITSQWITTIVMPRMRLLGERLSDRARPVLNDKTTAVTLTFEKGHRYSVGAQVTVSMALNRSTRRVKVRFAVDILPIVTDYAREGFLELALDDPEVAKLETFLDERILRFVDDYLTLNQPGSPYQSYVNVTDPVCGMTFVPASAVVSSQHGTWKYYFCASECREKFERDPKRYV